jgi:hypothetical protein
MYMQQLTRQFRQYPIQCHKPKAKAKTFSSIYINNRGLGEIYFIFLLG